MIVLAILTVQCVCAVFFVSDILMTLVGLGTHPIPWQARELLELAAAAGLMLGVIMGALALVRTLRLRRQAEARLRAASAAFMRLLDQRFDDWCLTPAEREVALLTIKGMSTGAIAALRSTSDGTVKAQSNAIYRKAEVSGRAQLLSLFIEEMIDSRQTPPGPKAPRG